MLRVRVSHETFALIAAAAVPKLDDSEVIYGEGGVEFDVGPALAARLRRYSDDPELAIQMVFAGQRRTLH